MLLHLGMDQGFALVVQISDKSLDLVLPIKGFPDNTGYGICCPSLGFRIAHSVEHSSYQLDEDGIVLPLVWVTSEVFGEERANDGWFHTHRIGNYINDVSP